ncbi:MAG TPA: type II toxin-antitoxin system HicA family toxin [Solirubrobacteraceae bacterium]
MSTRRRSTAGILSSGVNHRRRLLPCAAIKVREAIKLIEAAGWHRVRRKGSHRQYRHPRRPGTVTVAGHLRDELHPKTMASILRQAGLRQ